MAETTVTVTCPVCHLADVACVIDPGEPMRWGSTMEDGDPGWPAGVDDWTSECQCSISPLIDVSQYRAALEDLALRKWED